MFFFYPIFIKNFFRFLKKVLIIIVVYFIIISLFLYFFKKDRPKVSYDPIQKQREEIHKLINNPTFSKNKESQALIILYRAILCRITGETCTDNPKDADKNFNHSLFGFITNLITLPYVNPPASGIYWAYSSLQNTGFIPKIYAAEGIGFASIKPLMDIWKIFRDFSYMFLVIVLIFIGFMIMFRAKVNPQTVITVENALPKIIVSLLLITFSFAIVGFLIDLMYILIGFTISLFNNTNYNLNTDFVNTVTGGSTSLIKEIFSFNFYNAASGFIDIFPTTIKLIINLITTAISVYLVNFIFMGKIFRIEKAFGSIPAIGGALGFIVEGLIILVLSPFIAPFFLTLLTILTAVSLFFRIFIILFINYIELLIYIIFSPLILMIEAIPGRNTFSFWFKKIFFNIFVFYLVFILFNITKNISYTIAKSENQLWQPPFLYSVGYEHFAAFIALGILFIIPDIIKSFKQILGVKDAGIGFNLGSFFSGVGLGYAGTMSGIKTFTSLYQTPLIGNIIRSLDKDKKIISKIIPPSPESQYLETIAKKIGG